MVDDVHWLLYNEIRVLLSLWLLIHLLIAFQNISYINIIYLLNVKWLLDFEALYEMK